MEVNCLFVFVTSSLLVQSTFSLNIHRNAEATYNNNKNVSGSTPRNETALQLDSNPDRQFNPWLGGRYGGRYGTGFGPAFPPAGGGFVFQGGIPNIGGGRAGSNAEATNNNSNKNNPTDSPSGNDTALQLESNPERQFNPWLGGGYGGGYGTGFGPAYPPAGGGFGFPGGFPNIGGGGGGGGPAGGNALCPAGYWCESVDERRICGEGYFCPAGSQKQTACAAGTYARRGAAFCLRCPAGYRCPTGTDAATGKPKGAVYPLECVEGTYCPPGTGTAIPCPSGYYCTNENSPNFEPIPCPAGSYTNGAGKKEAKECLTCPAGTYSEAGASACTAGRIPNSNNGFGRFPNNGFGGFGGFPNFGGYGGGWNGYWGR